MEEALRTMIRFNSCRLWCCLTLTAGVILWGITARADQDVSKKYHYLRGAYQYGSVLKTNEFVEGDNLKGEPIDTFHSARLEFG